MLLTVLAIPFVFPVYWMLVVALKYLGDVFQSPPALWPADPQWVNFAEVFASGPFLRQFFNSFYIAALVTLGVLVISSLAGYAFARISFPARNVLFVVLLTALLVPAEATLLPLFQMLDAFGWLNTHLAIIVPDFGSGTMVLGVFLMRQFFRALPEELEQAGRIDGLGRPGLFFWIALPLARSPLIALGILTFLHSWNELLAPLVFLRSLDLKTIPQALVTLVDTNTGQPFWTLQMAGTFLSVVPVLLAFLIAQRHFIRGIAGTGIK